MRVVVVDDEDVDDVVVVVVVHTVGCFCFWRVWLG